MLRQEIEEKFYQGTFSWVDVMPNDAAALLKQFLRELPSPLLTPQYIEAFAQVESKYGLITCIRIINLYRIV